MTTIVIRSRARELTRVACSADEAIVHDDDAPVVIEAESYAGTVLYRGHVEPGETETTLRYVGGSAE